MTSSTLLETNILIADDEGETGRNAVSVLIEREETIMYTYDASELVTTSTKVARSNYASSKVNKDVNEKS